MTARVLDGQALAARMQEEIKPEVAAFTKKHGRPPGSGIVLAGSDPASEVYVRPQGQGRHERRLSRGPRAPSRDRVTRGCTRARHTTEREPASRRHPRAVAAAQGHGTRGGADGLRHDRRQPRTLTASGPRASACSCRTVRSSWPARPSGVIELLVREEIPIAGRHAVVVGRSDIVGKPMAMLLLHRDATVTICHSRTPDLAEICRAADILVAAVGRPGLVTRDFVKPGATVVDVGINRVTDAAVASGSIRRGTNDWPSFSRRAPCSSAMCIPRSSKWPARSRRALAASGRSRSRC